MASRASRFESAVQRWTPLGTSQDTFVGICHHGSFADIYLCYWVHNTAEIYRRVDTNYTNWTMQTAELCLQIYSESFFEAAKIIMKLIKSLTNHVWFLASWLWIFLHSTWSQCQEWFEIQMMVFRTCICVCVLWVMPLFSKGHSIHNTQKNHQELMIYGWNQFVLFLITASHYTSIFFWKVS